MSTYIPISNQTEENIYLSYNTDSSSELQYTYIPPGGQWTPGDEVLAVSVIDKAAYDAAANPITAWAGEYETETHYYDDFFSPLVIGADGSVSVAGEALVEFTFDEDTSTLSWNRQQIKDRSTNATITFTEPDGVQQFSGTIVPSANEGKLWYNGTKVSG